MSASSEPVVAQRSKKTLKARSLFCGPLIAALCLLFVTVGAPAAYADEDGPPSYVPTLQDYKEALSPGLNAESEATDAQAAEHLPHVDLGRSEALELLRETFRNQLEAPAGIFGELDAKEFLSNYVAVIPAGKQPDPLGGLTDQKRVMEQDEQPTLLNSTLPLRTTNELGKQQPIDLSLEYASGDIQIANPLTEVTIPSDLGEGIELPRSGVHIELVNGPDGRTPSTVEGTAAVYPNVARDTDFVVTPTPTGIETFAQMRSSQSPHTQTLRLDLPDGASLAEVEGEGAEVSQNGKPLIKVAKPTAIDATGMPVQVTITVEGNRLSFTTSPGPEVQFPILVDPLMEEYVWGSNTYTKMSDWKAETNGGPYMLATSAGCSTWCAGVLAPNSPGLWIGAWTNVPNGPNNQAGWHYHIPRWESDWNALGHGPTSYITDAAYFNMSFQHRSDTNLSPYLVGGLWWPEGGQFRSSIWHAGNQANYSLNEIWSLVGGNTAKEAIFTLVSSDSHQLFAPRDAWLGWAVVNLTDDDHPDGKAEMTSQWVNGSPSAAIPFKVTDNGLGVYAITATDQLGHSWETKQGCIGINSNPCPFEWNNKSGGFPALKYDPSVMLQGENPVGLVVRDPVGHASNQEVGGKGPSVINAMVLVDHTPPKLQVSGSLAEQATLGTSASQYALKYNATDGDSAAASALTPFGTAGTGEGKLEAPAGVATDSTGNIYVVDRVNSRVVKFNSAGSFLSQFGSPGAGKGMLNQPSGLAIDSQKYAWVVDSGNNRLVRFNDKGEFFAMYGRSVNKTQTDAAAPEAAKNVCTAASGNTCQAGIAGSGNGQFNTPRGIALTAGGNLLIADTGNNRVQKLSPGGEYLAKIGSLGSAPGQLNAPWDVAVAPDGAIWVADTGNYRIQKWSGTFEYLLRSGSLGGGDGQFESPTGIAVTPTGHPIVTDKSKNRVQVFQSDGSYLKKFGSAGSGSSQLSEARGLTFAADGTALVADAANHRIARWSHPDYDPQSGVTKVEVKVDNGTPKVLYNQACATEDCAKSGEWIYNANEYSTGQHTVLVTATDGVGLTAPKSLTVNSIKDTAPPQLTANSTFFTAPDGWLEQKPYSYSASASDVGGRGVTSLVLKVDGKVVATTVQSCPNGGCGKTLTGTLNMATYTGGVHPAELIATDGAGLTAKRAWKINVDPKGQVSAEEVADTLEAVEETAEVTEPVASTADFLEPEIIQAGDNPGFKQSAGIIESTGVPTSTDISAATKAVTVEGEDGTLTLTPVGTAASTVPGVNEDAAAVLPGLSGQADLIVRPEYNGSLIFQSIRDAASPEVFAWNVQPGRKQVLKLTDAQHAEMDYENGVMAFKITAEIAHDATGAAVPTHLEVQGSELRLVVEHHAGSYVYPVVAGQALETSYVPGIAYGIAGEEAPEDEGTPFGNPYPPTIGKSLSIGEVKHGLIKPRGEGALISKVREFEVDQEACHPDTCAAYSVHMFGALFTRHTNSVEWRRPGTSLYCFGDIDTPFTLSTSIDIDDSGFTGYWGVKKGSGRHLTAWCHFILNVWAVPVDPSGIPGVPSPVKNRAMQVWVYPNGFQTYYTRDWDGPPGPPIVEN